MKIPHLRGESPSGRSSGRAGAPGIDELSDGHSPDGSSDLAALTTAEKVRLLTGADTWSTHGSEALKLRPLTMSDGPSGVRGTAMDERDPSSCFPCPSALGATWDEQLIEEATAALGAEARAKGIDVLLAPTINLLRTPLGGRGFECFSEDPFLLARTAVAFVRGLQSSGVAAAVKHFVGNDSETERWTLDARIAPEALREVYLQPFEAAVREAEVGLVMAAYNAVNGVSMTENVHLLREVLKDEWGFDGVVVSDWHAARSTEQTALAGLDLVMPGPRGPWQERLVDAVRAGLVGEAEIDDKLRRLRRLAARFPAPAAFPADAAPADGVLADGVLADRAVLRRVARGSFVLLRNERDALPLDRSALRRVALIGPGARTPSVQGGGSVRVAAAGVSVPADAFAEVLDGATELTVHQGVRTWLAVPTPPLADLADPHDGEPGVRLEFLSADGEVTRSERRLGSEIVWPGDLPRELAQGGPGSMVLRTRYTPRADGPHLIGAAGVGRLRLTVDGEVVIAGETSIPDDPVEVMVRPGELRATVDLTAHQEVDIHIDFQPAAVKDAPIALRLGVVPAAHEDEDALIGEAVEAAAAADVAVVVVGSPDGAESEGFDRQGLQLPGRQDELVRKVAAAAARTVVVVNAGTPMLLPWAEEVDAVLYAWLPGQEMGHALTDVLFGEAEPGGRLPVTLPRAEQDCPVLHAWPRQGRLEYSEGLLVGYRGYDRAGTEPHFAFGHGLGYTDWEYEFVEAAADRIEAGEDLDVLVRVRNTGLRRGREVVQVYLAHPDAPATRPLRVLAAFTGVHAGPGEHAEARLRVPARAFAQFEAAVGAWSWPTGRFTVHAGRSSRDLRCSADVYVT